MRLNRYVAQATGLSRRAADALIAKQRVQINKSVASLGSSVAEGDVVEIDGQAVKLGKTFVTIILNKPAGYVCSRQGQGSKTIYDLLPAKYHELKPVGRLDKDSSGLLMLTNDGQLAHQLTHPRYRKVKQYEVTLDRPLTSQDRSKIEHGIPLDDGRSALKLEPFGNNGTEWQVRMHEGRNRQIRRTFAALGYTVKRLERKVFGEYALNGLQAGKWRDVMTPML